MITVVRGAYGPIAFFEDGSRAPLPRMSHRPSNHYRALFGYEILDQQRAEALAMAERINQFQRFLSIYPHHNPAINYD